MKTIQTSILSAVILMSVFSCRVKENERLRATVDSLQTELQTSVEVAQTLRDVGSLIDSIDYSRNLLTTHMIEGTTYDDYTKRLSDINQHVKNSMMKIVAMEESLRKMKSNNSYYATTIKKLKQDVESRTQQIIALNQEVKAIHDENIRLQQTVSLKEAELNEKSDIIRLNQESIVALETKINSIIEQASANQAEAYFKQAEALALAAQRTKFAPRKKKETRREALELYELAATLGYSEAAKKAEALKKSI